MLDISIQFKTATEPEPPSELFYRHKHDAEIDFEIPGTQYKQPWYWRSGDPEVYWIEGGSKTPFSEPWQRLAWELVRGVMNENKFTTLYDDHRAFMNNTGFWNKDSKYPYDPRANYITGEDMSSPLPEWDKIRTCGGHCMKGWDDGEWFYPDYLAYDESKPNDGAPPLEWLEAHPWLYFHAVVCHGGAGTYPSIEHFPQGGGMPVRIPFVARAGSLLKIPIQAVEKVDRMVNPLEV